MDTPLLLLLVGLLYIVLGGGLSLLRREGLSAQFALAWDDFGHRLVARMAYMKLEPGVRSQVDDLLGGGVDAFIEATLDNGSTLRFIPDPTNDAQLVPALPGGTKPKDGATNFASSTITSASSDFIAKQIKPGDVLLIDYVPVTGTVALAPANPLACTFSR